MESSHDCSRPAFLAYALLLVPALMLVWFHYAAFRAFVVGVHRVFLGKPLPAGFEWLMSYGDAVYLLPVVVVLAGLLSTRHAVLTRPVVIALCGAALGLAYVFYAILFALPILGYGFDM